MIKIQNQLTFQFSIGDVQDFIDPTNLEYFALYEEAGGLRPIIKLSFRLDNAKIASYLNEGSILTVNFGIDELTKSVMQFELYDSQDDRNFNLGYTVNISGAFYLPKFTSINKGKCYLNKSSIEVLREIATTHKLTLRTNITNTNDRQDWYQEGVSDWQFLTDVWLHSYINDKTFMIFGLDSDNIYFYDMRELVRTGSKWLFTNKWIAEQESNLVSIGSCSIKNNYGILNDLIGRNLVSKTYNIDTGKITDYSYALKNFTIIDSDKVNMNSTNCLRYNYKVISDDVHPNYIKAYNQNFSNNLMYSAFNIYVITALQMKRLRLLEPVEFALYPDDERLQGLSFITGIAYEYKNANLNINITLNKEAPSGIKSTDLDEGA